VTPLTGGCLCGALRYEAADPPLFMGHCYCGDCRKASGSGFIPYMGFAASAIRFVGESTTSTVKAANGADAVRNRCAACGSLVYGGTVGVDDPIGVYAGSLDDPSAFVPTAAIFTRGKPDWAVIPPGLKVFEAYPV